MQEQLSYDNIKPKWASLPADIRKTCIEMANAFGQNYAMLYGCIQLEIISAKEAETFELKR